MRLTEERANQSENLISRYLVKCHTDKDENSLFVRFSELMIDREELQQEIRSLNSVLRIISECNIKKELDECKHEFFCIYRHPGSDLRCVKCGKIITHDEYIKGNYK